MSLFARLADRLDDLLAPSPPPPPESASAPGPVLSLREQRRLAESAREDWLAIMRGLLDALEPVSGADEDGDSAEAAVRRMGRDLLRLGVEGLSWTSGPVLSALRSGVRRGRKRSATLRALGLEHVEPLLPPKLEQAASTQLAGVSAAVRVEGGARVLASATPIGKDVRLRCVEPCFRAYAREVDDVREQFLLAAVSEPALVAVPRSVLRAMTHAALDLHGAEAGQPIDLSRVRVVGYEPGSVSGVVARVTRPGLRHRGTMVRKCEVIAVRNTDQGKE